MAALSKGWFLQEKITRFFLISNPGWNWFKIKQMLTNTLRLNFCYLKIIHILHPHYPPKIIGHILTNKQNNKCFCIYEIIRWTKMKMKMKMKKRGYIGTTWIDLGPDMGTNIVNIKSVSLWYNLNVLIKQHVA